MAFSGDTVTRKVRFLRIWWVDATLLAVFLTPAAWMAAHTQRELESALGLYRAQWRGELASDQELNNRAMAGLAPISTPLSDLYAECYPRSPLTWLNQSHAKRALWGFCSQFQEQTLPAFFVASVGLGLIALRRGKPARLRARCGPGRVAAGLGVVLPAISIVEEFVLRRFNMMTYASSHDPLAVAWQRHAPAVGIAIAAAWMILLLGGRWKLRGGWREWLGLALGAAWLANFFWMTVLDQLWQMA
jgi:hypothetical protein